MPRLIAVVLAAATLVIPVAHAGAPPRTPIPEGTWVRLFDVGPQDAWYAHRAQLSDVVCQVGPGPMRPQTATWFDGHVRCDDGQKYTFYQVTFELLSGEPPVSSTAPQTTPGGTEPVCPEGAFTGQSLAEGSRVQVLAVHPDDAYWDVRKQLEGTEGLVAGDLHNNGNSCWFGGGFTADDGEYSYFYKAAVRVLAQAKAPGTSTAAAQPTCPEGVATNESIPKGHRVKIVDVHPDDAYYASRFDILGKSGTVDETLEQTGACWYAGSVVSDGGDHWYFFRASVVDLGVLQ